MAKKQRQSEISKPVTKRQLTRKEREKRTQRIIIIVSSVLLALVLGFVAYGFYDTEYRPYHEIVLEVNDTRVDMDYYLTILRAYLTGADRSQVDMMARSVPGAIVNNLLIIQRAPLLGYTVSKEEIDNEIADKMMPSGQAYRDIYASSVLAEKLKNGYFDPKIPKNVDQVKVMAMVVETEEIGHTVLKELEDGRPFNELVGQYGVENITNQAEGKLDWLMKGLTTRISALDDASVLEDIAFNMEPGQISTPVYDPNVRKVLGYWVLKVTEKPNPESCRVYGILLGSVSEAEDIIKRLEAGEDVVSLANQFSQDSISKQDGGDFGWIRKGYTSYAILDEAFDMEEGQISKPLLDNTIRTRGGYWIVQVIEKQANMPLEESTRGQMINQDMLDWLTEQLETSTVNEYLTTEQQYWAINKVVK